MTRAVLLIVFILAGIGLNAQSSVDEIRINEVFRNTPLSKALKTIESKYNIRIAYDPVAIQNIRVALRLHDLTLSKSFELLLEGTPLSFHHVGENIVIVPRPSGPAKGSTGRTNLTLAGNVLDVDTEETLPQATIRVVGTNVVTTANNDGHFTLFNIPSDTCSLEISFMGYITQTIRVKDIDKPDQYNAALKSDTKLLNEVVVLDEYNQAIHIEDLPGAAVFNIASLSSLPSMGEQDLSRTLQLLPGVTATDESSSGMFIRGSHPSYNLTLLDGITIYQQDHFFGSLSIINSDIIKDVHVHKGMFDAKYGARVSGVVDITSKNGNSIKPAFNFKLNFLNAKATVEIPIGKKWSFFAAARRSYTDQIQSNIFTQLFDIAQSSNDQVHVFRFLEGLGAEIPPQYYFFDTNTKLTFRPSSRDVISLSFYMSRDKMNIGDSLSLGEGTDKFSTQSDEITQWGNNGLSVRWGRQWNDKYYSNLRVSDSKFFKVYEWQQEAKLDTINLSYMLSMENSITDLTYAVDNEWIYNNKLSFEFGMSGMRQGTIVTSQDRLRLNTNAPSDEEDSNSSEDERSWLHSAYASTTISPGSRLTASLGARLVHYYNQQSMIHAEPRVTARYKLHETLNLKAGYGRSKQFLTQLFFHATDGIISGTISGMGENYWMLSQPGDPRSPVVSCDHVSTGATFKARQFSYDFEAYVKKSEGVIMDDDLNSGNTNVYGLDIMVQKTSGIHKGWIAYSIGRATQDHPYILNGRTAPAWQDQRHELKVVDMLTLGNWNLSSTLIYGSGKPYPKYNVRYHYKEDGLIRDYDLLLDYSNQSRLPDYFRIDLAASYRLRIRESSNIEMGISIHNITNHRNVKTRKIDQPALERTISTSIEIAPVYNDVVLLGFSPTLFLNISF